MEEKPLKARTKSLSPNDSVKSSSKSDIRNLWTKATLSQPKLNVLTNVCDDSDQEDSSSRSKSGQWYRRKTCPERAWEKRDDRKKGSITQGELDGHALEQEQSPSSFQKNHVEGVQDSGELDSSVSSVNVLKHTHHRAYWAEQQDRLPLPLMELMVNEALEILTKARRSYRSAFGKDHFLTHQLQGQIEDLEKQRNGRQQVPEP
ncbi:cation channel sperm-associated protein subunit zeta [Myotis myotis]|uniref:Catsper channel auxiliary subunit zeta n=1 Tax=Myotis myotis TaxID=51298 RepID=A0A7J7VGD0_MYOMY|nr:cation channel sperm-associated protein subunit zeta [Myotis myotis]KAF6324202.1 catsper channel auxiliary subunit zeta [Myotis myotis]